MIKILNVFKYVFLWCCCFVIVTFWKLPWLLILDRTLLGLSCVGLGVLVSFWLQVLWLGRDMNAPDARHSSYLNMVLEFIGAAAQLLLWAVCQSYTPIVWHVLFRIHPLTLKHFASFHLHFLLTNTTDMDILIVILVNSVIINIMFELIPPCCLP